MTAGSDPLADLRAAIDLVAKASRVIIVHPDREEVARAAVDASPFPGLLDVQVSPHCPVGQVFVIPAISDVSEEEPV